VPPRWCASAKFRYTSRHVARAEVRHLRSDGDPRGAALNVYRCESCGDWHVGHSSR
jgi:hypothetical protein